MNKLFSRKIVFFNFFYSLVIICYHANATVHFGNVVSSGTLVDGILGGVNQIFTRQSGTYFFMLLSAFQLYRDITPDNAVDKVRRRIHTLLIPWLLWNLIGLLADRPFDQSLKSIFCDYFMSRFCEQLWFVEALFLFLVLIPLFMRILKVRVVRECLLIVLFVLGYLGFPMIQALPLFPSEQFRNEVMRILTHLPVYSLGAYFGLNFAKPIMEETYNLKCRKAVAVGAVALLVFSYLPTRSFLQNSCFMLRAMALWVLCRKEYFAFEPRWWMQLSFYVYAIHNFILYAMGRLIRLSGIFAEQYARQSVSVTFALLWRVCLAAAAFGLALLSAVVLMRFVPRFYELLAGGRIPRKASASVVKEE